MAPPCRQFPPPQTARMPSTPPNKKSARRSRPTKGIGEPIADAPEALASRRERRKPTPKRSPAKARAHDMPAHYDSLLRAACIRAGTAAAVASLSSRIPVLGWVAPSVLSIFTDKLSVKQIQDELIRAVIDQSDTTFTLREKAAVALLARTAQVGTQHLSQRTLDALLRPLGNSGLVATLGRTLPMAAIAADIFAAVASTWLVGQRTRAMCQLPGQQGTSATDVLSSLSGIDQKRLLGWSAEALKQVVLPLRSLLNLLRKA
ncbi:MAG: hypothetical protein R3F04_14220 [Lysobacteraceae bacterium]